MPDQSPSHSDSAAHYPHTGMCRCGRPNIYCEGHGDAMPATFRNDRV